MFSTFSSYLPSGFQPSEKSTPITSTFEHDPGTTLTQDHDEGVSQTVSSRPAFQQRKASDADTEELGVKKRSKKERSNETFIVVRPPPAKSNHPLNLQVQLVPPNSRSERQIPSMSSTDQRRSMEFSTPNTPITPQRLQSSPTQMQHTIDDNQLTRIASNRSEASIYSASTASFTSFSSSSTSGGRRAIVPLYNLQAHNVMTNMVVDAGTDAKIAKFQKRGIEFLGLALLDPVEVWPKSRTGDGLQNLRQDGPRGTVYLSGGDGFLSANGNAKGLTTPERQSVSSLSTTSVDHHLQQQQQQQQHRFPVTPTTPGGGAQQTPVPSPMPTPTPNSKKISFGRFFGGSKKKESSNNNSNSHSRTPSLLDSSPLGSLAPPRTSFAKRLSASLSSPPPPHSPQQHLHAAGSHNHLPRTPTHMSAALPDITVATDSPLQHQQAQAHEAMATTMPLVSTSGKLRPPVLGVQAALSSPVHPPIGRPYKYVWVVRRWIKGGEGGLLSGMKGRLGAGLGNGGGAGDGYLVEVRFEWAKSTKDKDKAKRKEKSPAAAGGDGSDGRSRSTSRRGSPSTPPEGSVAGEEDEEEREIRKARSSRALKKRRSVISHHSISTVADTEDGHGRADDGDESDPEDSETPWNCTLRLTARQNVDTMPPPAKLKVATLTPSPHHPKVLGVLRIPFPLPDVEVEAMAFRPRVLPLLQPAEPGTPGGLMLTAEEIKDIVSTTAMWLIVREGFGGLGKVARKGDGWLIRS